VFNHFMVGKIPSFYHRFTPMATQIQPHSGLLL
jgi:hypothetical protein